MFGGFRSADLSQSMTSFCVCQSSVAARFASVHYRGIMSDVWTSQSRLPLPVSGQWWPLFVWSKQTLAIFQKLHSAIKFTRTQRVDPTDTTSHKPEDAREGPLAFAQKRKPE